MKVSLLIALSFCASLLAAGQGLNATEEKIIKAIRQKMPYHLQLLEQSVNINSGSLNTAGVKQVGELMAKAYRNIGFQTEWVNLPDSLKRAGHLVAYTKGTKGKRLLLIGHLDTVFEPDMEANPYRKINDSTVTGQGVADMKGGNIVMLAACDALQSLGLLKDATVVAYYTGDEEKTGEPQMVSRADLIERAKQCDIALGFETAQGLQTVAVGRRGYSEWALEVEAPQAHSAGIFSNRAGYGAAFELSRVVNQFRERLAGQRYLTFNPGIMVAGTELDLNEKNIRANVSGKSNIISPHAYASGDLRFISLAQRDSARGVMRAIAAESLNGTKTNLRFMEGFPAMEPKPGNYALVNTLSQVSIDLGMGKVVAGDPGSRGAGDISFVSFLDAIDGLGASGSGAHAPGETMSLKEFPMLVERAALLIYRLTR
jgi:glutamate carboxypeptidase